MVHRTNIHSVSAEDPVDKIVDEILASSYTRVPLWEEKPENIVGVVHAADLPHPQGGRRRLRAHRHPPRRQEAVVRP